MAHRKRRATMTQLPVVVAVIVAATLGLATANLDQDKAECTNQLVGLAGCLSYVGGDAKAPTVDCCSGLKEVITKSRKCLCVLIKDRDDPELGLKINATLALGLPTTCHTPINITECVDLLHLDPKSTEAQIFEEYTNGNSSTTPTTSSPSSDATANSTSNGPSNRITGKKIYTGMALGVTCGAVLWMFTSNHWFYV